VSSILDLITPKIEAAACKAVADHTGETVDAVKRAIALVPKIVDDDRRLLIETTLAKLAAAKADFINEPPVQRAVVVLMLSAIRFIECARKQQKAELREYLKGKSCVSLEALFRDMCGLKGEELREALEAEGDGVWMTPQAAALYEMTPAGVA
jgi:hypothetical protein